MADDLKNSYTLPSLLTISLRSVVSVLPHYMSEVECMPPHIKSKLLHLMCKRGLVTDEIINKVIHSGTKVLNLEDCDITDAGLKRIICKNLRKLDLNSAKASRTEITSAGLEAIAVSCPLLQTVFLRRCLNVTDDGVIALAKSCHQLIELNIGGCHLIRDASLLAIAQNCRMLRSFNFSKTKVTDEGVISLAMGSCQQTLMEVHMDHCIHLTDDSVEAIASFCPQLAILIFHGCPCMTDRSRLSLEELQGPGSNMKQVTWTIY
ncbi:protein AMN1 homolog [Asterias rubens]|uniref:protein AMN1 homolog n=1 Tax=Asterias rubens TaxID=7604 RepID=UPI0014559A34|nr:protein AMN1 homolog [Asterias rubens]